MPLTTTLSLSQTVGGVGVMLTLEHALLDNVILALQDAHGPITACQATPAANADCTLSVKVTLTQLDDNTSDTETAADLGGGHFALPTAPYFALDGNWQVVVVARRYNQPDDVEAAFSYVLNGAQLTGKISDYMHVRVQTDPDPPVSGPVALTFTLTDQNGQPITDATVNIQGIMPTHGHVTADTPIRHVSGGDYTGSLLLPMQGGWAVDLTIARPGQDTLVTEVSLDLAASAFDLTPYPSPNVTPAP